LVSSSLSFGQNTSLKIFLKPKIHPNLVLSLLEDPRVNGINLV